MAGLLLVEWLQRRLPASRILPENVHPGIRFAVASLLLWGVVYLGEFGNRQFIYFVF